MLVLRGYVKGMGDRRAAFHRALRYFIENGKNITQTRISKATGIKQGMISGMKTGKRWGTEEGRRWADTGADHKERILTRMAG